MDYKKLMWFLVAFIISGFVGGLTMPYIPATGNPTLQWLIGYAVPGFILFFIWEKFFRKQAGGA